MEKSFHRVECAPCCIASLRPPSSTKNVSGPEIAVAPLQIPLQPKTAISMQALHAFLAIPFALTFSTAAFAQNTLKDGTALLWDKEITATADSLRNDSVTVPAFSVPVYESSASQVTGLLKTVVPGASFKKQGGLLKAVGASFGNTGTPMDILAKVVQDKKQGMSTLTLAFLQPGTSAAVDNATLQPAVREAGVALNKAVVQAQVDEWKKKLGKADSKTTGAAKAQDKTQGKLNKAQVQLEKAAKEKSKLQSQQAIQQKQIDLENQKWTLSQDPKDLKRLTKARAKITKIEGKMAKVMTAEAKAQADISKYGSSLPDAQKAREAKAAVQADVQRTVDSLQRKLESIR